jgi:pimeloyl-ACP methyl ester carboxylesterase
MDGPYVLVGHSFGGYNVRAFADRYVNDVAGMVLVDGEDGDVESQRDRLANDRAFETYIKQLRKCRDALAAGRALPVLGARHGHGGIACPRQFFRGLPERRFSDALNAAILAVVNSKIALYDEVISEMAEMPWDEEYLIRSRRSLGKRPLRILTAQNHYDDTSHTGIALHRKHTSAETALAHVQGRWLSLSSNSEQIFAYASGHYIQLDQPNLVIDAIRSIIQEWRTNRVQGHSGS